MAPAAHKQLENDLRVAADTRHALKALPPMRALRRLDGDWVQS